MRPSLDTIMMYIAHTLALRGTCAKRKVGCVLVDRMGRIIGSGYNGVPAGRPHCIDVPCGGADRPAGSDTCEAVHAELNALLNCRDVNEVCTIYTTVLPCNNCMKTLLNTSAKHLVFGSSHDNAEQVLRLWQQGGRTSALHII